MDIQDVREYALNTQINLMRAYKGQNGNSWARKLSGRIFRTKPTIYKYLNGSIAMPLDVFLWLTAELNEPKHAHNGKK
jgi:hypothetical protein